MSSALRSSKYVARMIATRALAKHHDFMTEHDDPCASEFTGHDRRRLRQATSARLFRRLQAVLRVAEGESCRPGSGARPSPSASLVQSWYSLAPLLAQEFVATILATYLA